MVRFWSPSGYPRTLSYYALVPRPVPAAGYRSFNDLKNEEYETLNLWLVLHQVMPVDKDLNKVARTANSFGRALIDGVATSIHYASLLAPRRRVRQPSWPCVVPWSPTLAIGFLPSLAEQGVAMRCLYSFSPLRWLPV